MTFKKQLAIIFSIVSGILLAKGQDAYVNELWKMNSLTQIGGHGIEVMGNPQIVDTELGPAMEFSGENERIVVDANPVADAKEFTIEVLLKPDAGINKENQPRFIHIQDPDDPAEKRILLELRVNGNDQVYFDGFIKTDKAKLTLIDETKTHPSNEWIHAALVFSNQTMSTYINGKPELTGSLEYDLSIINPTGKTSIGGRMDQRNWYKGLIHSMKISHKALSPDEFMSIQDTATMGNPHNSEIELCGMGSP
jgi:hypothetical protein